MFIAMCALTGYRRGRPDELRIADGVARRLMADARWPESLAWLAIACGLHAAFSGDYAGTRRYYGVIQRNSRRSWLLLSLATEHALGVVSNTSGEVEGARGHMLSRSAYLRRTPFGVLLAWLLLDLAELLPPREAAPTLVEVSSSPSDTKWMK